MYPSKPFNRYEVREDYAILFVPHIKESTIIEFIVDLESLNKLIELGKHWHVYKSNGGFYAGRALKINGRKHYISLHRYLLGLADITNQYLVADHINHNTLDNRLINLRGVTNSINVLNRRPTIGRVYGVSWNAKIKKWRVRMTLNYKQKHLGYFADKEEAIRVSIAAREEVFKNL